MGGRERQRSDGSVSEFSLRKVKLYSNFRVGFLLIWGRIVMGIGAVERFKSDFTFVELLREIYAKL